MVAATGESKGGPSAAERILEAAGRLFAEHGIHPTGVNAIVAEAGVAKMSLYKHFGSKKQLALAVLRHQSQEEQRRISERIEGSGAEPRERLLIAFDLLDELFRQPDYRGSRFVNAAAHFPDPDDAIHQMAADHQRWFEQYMSELAGRAGARDPELLGAQLVLLSDGAVNAAFVSGDTAAARVARKAAETLIAAALDGGQGDRS